MAEVKIPISNHGLLEYFPEEVPAHELVVKIADADKLFAALERRLRIAERAMLLMDLEGFMPSSEARQTAEREIDAEQEEQR